MKFGFSLKSCAQGVSALILALTVSLTLSVTVTAVSSTGAEARANDYYDMITVQSQEDFRTITVPVRQGRNGPEVRIPNGTWLECEYSCEYTVQNEYLDLFTCGTVFNEGGCSPGVAGDLLGRFRR